MKQQQRKYLLMVSTVSVLKANNVYTLSLYIIYACKRKISKNELSVKIFLKYK